MYKLNDNIDFYDLKEYGFSNYGKFYELEKDFELDEGFLTIDIRINAKSKDLEIVYSIDMKYDEAEDKIDIENIWLLDTLYPLFKNGILKKVN